MIALQMFLLLFIRLLGLVTERNPIIPRDLMAAIIIVSNVIL